MTIAFRDGNMIFSKSITLVTIVDITRHIIQDLTVHLGILLLTISFMALETMYSLQMRHIQGSWSSFCFQAL